MFVTEGGQGGRTFELSFAQKYGRDLSEAHEWCQRYKLTRSASDLNQAWEFYAGVFRQISKELANLNYLELQYVSPSLQRAHNLELSVPGTIQLASKQRARRLRIMGSDGDEFTFLLKGHEDLRLDERVMQLFSLVNTLLRHDTVARRHKLLVRGYAIIPLYATAGILEWVPDCETMHEMIRDYRLVVNLENRLQMAAPRCG